MRIEYTKVDAGHYRPCIIIGKSDNPTRILDLGDISKAQIETPVGPIDCWEFKGVDSTIQGKTLGAVKGRLEDSLFNVLQEHQTRETIFTQVVECPSDLDPNEE